MTEERPRVGVVMGSSSDWPVMQAASEVLTEFDVPHECHVRSAHRTPDDMLDYAKQARSRGLEVIVAGAGGAAHLPGMLAAATTLPVVGVPVGVTKLNGWDALLSIAQMPKGVPVATVAVDNARNGALLALRILAVTDTRLAERLEAFAAEQAARARAQDAELVHDDG